MTLQISRDLGHFTGGLVGKCMIYQLGFNDKLFNSAQC